MQRGVETPRLSGRRCDAAGSATLNRRASAPKACAAGLPASVLMIARLANAKGYGVASLVVDERQPLESGG
jgi:hypothetical protein